MLLRGSNARSSIETSLTPLAMINFTREITESRQRQDEARRLTNTSLALVYSMRKDRCDQHAVSCTCADCDWVADYEHEQSILHPVSEPSYCF